MAVPWFNDYPPAGLPWQFSINSGGTYNTYPGGNFAQPNGLATGVQRFRQQFVVPPGVTATYLKLNIAGDIYSNPNPAAAEIRIDGVFVSFKLPRPGTSAVYIPMSLLPPGPHTFEIWLGATSDVGVSRLDLVQASLIETPAPCNCGSPTWIPAIADSFTGFSAVPQTSHVNAISATPTFTISGPIRGVRFRAPDIGAPGNPSGDGAILFNTSTNETGAIPAVGGWAPPIPAFPATVAGPNTRVLSGITVTVNRDGKLSQTSGAAFRLAKQNANPPASLEFEWYTIEFSSPVTNFQWAGAAYSGGGSPPNEGISQLQVLSDSPPCNCCSLATLGERCYRQEELQAIFSSVNVITTGGAGNATILPITRWIDQDITGANFTGWTSPGIQWTDTTSPQIEFLFATPIDRLTRIQEYNQGGGDLGDLDGFGSAQVDFFNAGGALIYTTNFTMGNGGAPFSLTLPTPLYNVSRIRWRNMRKLNPGATVSPLTREFQAFFEPVRIAQPQICNGEITWFDSVTGDQVDPVNFITCPPIP